MEAFALSADGKTLATAAGRVVVLWDPVTGRELRRFDGHDTVMALALTPDGKTLATGANDNLIRLWDTTRGTEVGRCTGHQTLPPRQGREFEGKGIFALAFTPDGRTLVSRGADETIRLWETGTGKELRKHEGMSGFARFALSPDGKKLAAVVGDFNKDPGEVRVWETATGKVLRRVTDAEVYTCVAFSPDGQLLAAGVGGRDWNQPGHIQLVDAATGRKVRRLGEYKRWVTAVAFSADGQTLATGSYDASPRLWDAASGKLLAKVSDQPMPVYGVAFTPDGKYLLLRAGNVSSHALRVWDLAAGKEAFRLGGHQSHVTDLAFSDDGRYLLSGSADATAALWDVARRKELRRLSPGDGVSAVAFADKDRQVLAGGLVASRVYTWDLAGKSGPKIDLKDGFFARIAFGPGGKLVASWGRGQGVVRLTDAASGKELRLLRPAPQWANAIAFSPDGRLVAVGGGTNAPFISLWDVETGRHLRSFATEGFVLALAFSADGRALAAGHDDRKIRLWEVATGQVRLIVEHGDRPTALAFSPDGALLTSACNNTRSNPATNGMTPPVGLRQDTRDVRVWDVLSGRRVHTFEGHGGPITTLAFSPDGRLLASGSNDTTILLWEVTRLPRGGQKAVELGKKELEARWDALKDADAAAAYAIMRELVGSPRQALDLLKVQLKPATETDRQRVAGLVADLDSPTFRKRDEAARELLRLGPGAEPALCRALAAGPSLEARRRIESVLDKLQGPQHVRIWRAVEVLERIGTPAAREQLQTLAKGSADSELTRTAREALRRLDRRPGSVAPDRHPVDEPPARR
jgi:WD40 repeat protein